MEGIRTEKDSRCLGPELLADDDRHQTCVCLHHAETTASHLFVSVIDTACPNQLLGRRENNPVSSSDVDSMTTISVDPYLIT